MKYFLKNKIDAFLIGRKNSIIPEHSNNIFFDIPFNKNCQFLKSTFTSWLSRIVILLNSTLLILKNKPNYIFSRDIYFSLYFVFLSKILRFKTIYESHGFIQREMNYQGKVFKGKFITIIENIVLSKIDYIICISDTLKDRLSEKVPNKRIFVIPNGISIREIDSIKDEISSSYLIKRKKPTRIIGFIGNWEEWITIEDFLNASEYLSGNFLLVIVGKGKNYQKFKNIYPKVRFRGRLSKKLTLLNLNLFDICISPWSDKSIFSEN